MKAALLHGAGLLALIASTAVAAATEYPALPGIDFTPFHKDGIYQLGEPAGWTVSVAKGMTPAPGRYAYVIRENDGPVIKSGTLDLSHGSARIEISLDHPAMLYAQVSGPGSTRPGPTATEIATLDWGLHFWMKQADAASVQILSKYPHYTMVPLSRANAPEPARASVALGAAVAPNQFKPTVPRPADFDQFWAGKLEALSHVPMNPQLTPVLTGQPGVTVEKLTLDSLNSHVHGYLARPEAPGRYPLLIIYQYAGVYALDPSVAADRAAEGWLVLDVDSHDLDPGQSTGVPQDYQTIGDTSRETSYFLNMYLRDTRALNYMRSRPDWDGKTVVFYGNSMGGQQSIVTAGLNPGKVSAVVVGVPAGGDASFALNGHSAAYPFWNDADPKVAETARYFDTVNFASRITAPVLAAMGFIDTIATPKSIWTMLDQIKGPTEAVPMIESDHDNITPDRQGAYYERSQQVLANLLVGRPFIPNQLHTRDGR